MKEKEKRCSEDDKIRIVKDATDTPPFIYESGLPYMSSHHLMSSLLK